MRAAQEHLVLIYTCGVFAGRSEQKLVDAQQFAFEKYLN